MKLSFRLVCGKLTGYNGSAGRPVRKLFHLSRQEMVVVRVGVLWMKSDWILEIMQGKPIGFASVLTVGYVKTKSKGPRWL